MQPNHKNSLEKVRTIEAMLRYFKEYKDDFGKHLDENEDEVFDSILSQHAKENKKIQYSKIKVKGRSADYHEAIQWLVDAGIVSQCFNLSNLELPLEGNKLDNIFKLYMRDSGLFIAMVEKGTAGEILSGNLSGYKGAIYENIIADAFSKMDRKLYYFHKDSGLEVDFITKYKNEVVLVEVKATTGNTKSTNTILDNYENYKVNRCIKLGEYNIGEVGKK